MLDDNYKYIMELYKEFIDYIVDEYNIDRDVITLKFKELEVKHKNSVNTILMNNIKNQGVDYHKMSLKDLKEICKNKGLLLGGKKTRTD